MCDIFVETKVVNPSNIDKSIFQVFLTGHLGLIVIHILLEILSVNQNLEVYIAMNKKAHPNIDVSRTLSNI